MKEQLKPELNKKELKKDGSKEKHFESESQFHGVFSRDELRQKDQREVLRINYKAQQEKLKKDSGSMGLSAKFSSPENPEIELSMQSELSIFSNPPTSELETLNSNEDIESLRYILDKKSDYQDDLDIPQASYESDTYEDDDMKRAIAESLKDQELLSARGEGGYSSKFTGSAIFDDSDGPAKRGPVRGFLDEDYIAQPRDFFVNQMQESTYEEDMRKAILASIEDIKDEPKFFGESIFDSSELASFEDIKDEPKSIFDSADSVKLDSSSQELDFSKKSPSLRDDYRKIRESLKNDSDELKELFEKKYKSFKSKRLFSKEFQPLLDSVDDQVDEDKKPEDKEPSRFSLYNQRSVNLKDKDLQDKDLDSPAKKSNSRNP